MQSLASWVNSQIRARPSIPSLALCPKEAQAPPQREEEQAHQQGLVRIRDLASESSSGSGFANWSFRMSC